MNIVKKGSTGNDVKRIQQTLKQIGLYNGKIDSIFDFKTEKAVKEFQRTFGVVSDGIVGPKTWNLLNKAKQVKHFKVREFACRHCGQVRLNIDLLLKLEQLRTKTGPLVINSGYRCPTHNKNINGAKNSQHIQGRAADIRATNMTPNIVATYAEQVGFDGIGKYQNFTHVDVRGYKARWRG